MADISHLEKISYWRYGVVKTPLEGGTIRYGMHEIYFDDKDNPISCSVEPEEIVTFNSTIIDLNRPEEEILKDLEERLTMMLADIKKKIYNLEDIGK